MGRLKFFFLIFLRTVFLLFGSINMEDRMMRGVDHPFYIGLAANIGVKRKLEKLENLKQKIPFKKMYAFGCSARRSLYDNIVPKISKLQTLFDFTPHSVSRFPENLKSLTICINEFKGYIASINCLKLKYLRVCFNGGSKNNQNFGELNLPTLHELTFKNEVYGYPKNKTDVTLIPKCFQKLIKSSENLKILKVQMDGGNLLPPSADKDIPDCFDKNKSLVRMEFEVPRKFISEYHFFGNLKNRVEYWKENGRNVVLLVNDRTAMVNSFRMFDAFTDMSTWWDNF